MIDLLQQAAGRQGEKVSVLIPCHNREDYIGECLDSVLNQTLPKELLEIVVVDDASTDRTREILHRYEERYPENILLVESDDPSKGYVGKVRNLTLQYASGGVIAFIDSDDKYAPEMLELLYKYMLLYQADVVSCSLDFFNGSGVIGQVRFPMGNYSTDQPEDRKNLILQHGVDGTAWNKLYRTEFLRNNDLWFPENLRLHDDTCFSVSCLLAAKKYLHIDKILYHYRENENGIYYSDQTAKYLTDSLSGLNTLDTILKQYGGGTGEEHIEMECLMYDMIFALYNKCIEIRHEKLYQGVLPEIKALIKAGYPQMSENPYITGLGETLHINCRKELFAD